MNTSVQNPSGITHSDKTAPMTQAAQAAWTVNFTAPVPLAMPTDRLKARAELVRNALCTGSY